MPRPKHTAKSREFLLMDSEAGIRGERNDCTVKALALATNISYHEAHADLAARGRKARQGTDNYTLREAIHERGFKLEWVSAQHFINQYPKSHQILKHITTHHPERFNKVWRDGETYMLSCPGHVLIVHNGENLDWSKGSSKRVWHIYRITRSTMTQRAYDLTTPQGGIVGFICHYKIQGGWTFISNTSARGNGRKYHPTPDAAIPHWCKRMGATLSSREER